MSTRKVRVLKQFAIGSSIFSKRLYSNPVKILVDFTETPEAKGFSEFVGVTRDTESYSPSFINVNEFAELKSYKQVEYIDEVKDVPADIADDQEKVAIYKNVLVGNLNKYLDVAKAKAADTITDILEGFEEPPVGDEDTDGQKQGENNTGDTEQQ